MVLEPVRNAMLNYLLIAGAIGLSLLLLVVLHSAPPNVRRWVIAGVTFLMGLYFPVEFFIPKHNFLTPWRDSVADLAQVLTAFTFGLGVINLLIIHGRHLLRRTANFPFSMAFFLGFLSMAVVGFFEHYAPEFWATKAGTGQLPFWKAANKLLFEGMLMSLSSTVFSLLAFFIVSAAYRAFRIRTVEAGLLMAAAVLIMLANVPVGPALTSWLPEGNFLRVENLAIWLTVYINAPAMRAILFGLWVGALGIALRIWLSLERTFTVGGQ